MMSEIEIHNKQKKWFSWAEKKKLEIIDDYKNWNFESVSVVICCKDKSKVLPLVLKAINNQIVSANEIILADDHSTDDSISVFKNFCAANNIDYCVVQPERKGSFQLNTIRNLGIEASNCDIIIIIDADLVVGPGFIQAHLNMHKSKSGPVSSVGPLFEAADDQGGGPIGFMWGHEAWAHVTHAALGRVPTWATVLGGNLGIHKRLWKISGGFDTIYDGNYGVDDQDIHYRFHLLNVYHLGDFQAHVIHLPHENVLGNNRNPVINLERFKSKYGVSIYNARNIPEQIDWLGWGYGPWHKMVKKLYSGSVNGALTRASTIVDRGDADKQKSVVLTEEMLRRLRRIFDYEYVSKCAGKDISEEVLFEKWLRNPEFYHISINRYICIDINNMKTSHININPFAAYYFYSQEVSFGTKSIFNINDYCNRAEKKGYLVPQSDAFEHFWRVGKYQNISPNIFIDMDMVKNDLIHNVCELDNIIINWTSNKISFSKFFDVEYYVNNDNQINEFPLAHYLQKSQDRRSPNRLFNIEWYRKKYMSNKTNLEEFGYFLREGYKQGHTPNPFVDLLPISYDDDQAYAFWENYLNGSKA